ncbi:MAG: signal peptidase I [Firmicutes bacterium]|nr:signal peptidase I [Bacillota bacterium]
MIKTKQRKVALPTMEQVGAERRRLKHRALYGKALRGTVYTLLIVAAIAVLISSIFLPVMQISGDSMEPVLHNDDVVVLTKTTSFHMGELICFSWNNKTLLKRVIAGPGDWVEMDDKGTVYINGEALEEPYVTEPGLGECDTEFPVQVPEDSYWVMGDKRISSIDSRSTVIGFVNYDQIIGKVLLQIWPLNQIGSID